MRVQVRGGDYAYPERGKQLVLFDGMEYENGMRPTDIDLLIEYDDTAYVFGDLKYRDTPVTRGQRLALERMARDFRAAGKAVFCFIAEHDVPVGQDVHAKDAIVREYYRDGRWRCPSARWKLGERVSQFLAMVG